MSYLVLKTVHILANLLWVSGVVVTPWLAHPICSQRRDESQEDLLSMLRSYDLQITSPAMILTWTMGLWMSSQAQWWVFGWFRAKLVAALLLSALHGVAAGRIRRCLEDCESTASLAGLAQLQFLLAASMVTLVIFKPVLATK